MAKTPEEEHPQKVYFGWAARDNSGVLSPFNFSRRANGDNDITLDVLYCGICRSDLHYIKNDWNNSEYPLVPGHEIVGVVTEVGSSVTKFKVGDKAAQGGMVASCRSCDSCSQNLENYCSKMVLIYNEYIDGTKGYGGFSNKVVIDEHFAVRIPNNMPLDAVAPLLCAGSGAYGALKYYGLDKPEMHLGVVGLGGIGHLAVKFAKAFGMKVTVISTSISKKEYAINRLGADEFLGSNDPGQMQAAMGTLDGIIDTVPDKHSLLPLICLLKTGGKIVTLGLMVDEPHLPVIPLILGGKLIGGSIPVGMKETQEMIDFAAKQNITADIEVIPMDYVNTAFERLAKGDVKCRFVVDVANTLKPL